MACFHRNLLSLQVSVKRFAQAVRSHWGIANGCPGSLDIIYREEESRIGNKQLRENCAWLKRLTLSLLKQHPGEESILMKRRCCGWSDQFLLDVLTGATPYLDFSWEWKTRNILIAAQAGARA